MIVSLLFISDSLLSDGEREPELRDIVDSTMRNNGWLQLSGALIYSRSRFTQLIEGPESSVDLMLARIRADARHTNMRIVQRELREERRLPGWKLAYSGGSLFVERAIEALTHEPADASDHEDRIERLLALVVGLGRTG